MRGKHSDYFENSRRATHAHRQYAIANPAVSRATANTAGGSRRVTARGPSTLSIKGEKRRFFGYKARGAPEGPDDGSLAPWSVAASLPFAPRDCRAGSAIFRDAEAAGKLPLWFQGHIQRNDCREIPSAAIMGFAVPLRHQPAAPRPDDRKFPHTPHLEPDAAMSLSCGGTRQGRLCRRLARPRMRRRGRTGSHANPQRAAAHVLSHAQSPR
jgi:hypothetical protein